MCIRFELGTTFSHIVAKGTTIVFYCTQGSGGGIELVRGVVTLDRPHRNCLRAANKSILGSGIHVTLPADGARDWDSLSRIIVASAQSSECGVHRVER